MALNGLKTFGIIHRDIKLDNIMFLNMEKIPLGIKLIDFGSATPISNAGTGLITQVIGYRSPEVCLGLLFTEAIVTWSLSCIVAVMYLGTHMYPIECEYDMVRMIVTIQGKPEDHLLNAGEFYTVFFTKNKDPTHTAWRLNSEEEYTRLTKLGAKTCPYISRMLKCLDDLKDIQPIAERDIADIAPFLSLLKQMLRLNPEKRRRL